MQRDVPEQLNRVWLAVEGGERRACQCGVNALFTLPAVAYRPKGGQTRLMLRLRLRKKIKLGQGCVFPLPGWSSLPSVRPYTSNINRPSFWVR